MPWLRNPHEQTLPVNGELVCYYRQLRGWTQGQFAETAGYSRRLVSKAEANGVLRRETISDLADSLSIPGSTVTPEDLVSDPQFIGWKFIELFAKRERAFVRYFQDALAEDAICYVSGSVKKIPFAGRYVGNEGMQEYADRFFGMMQRPRKLIFVESATVMHQGNLVMIDSCDVWKLPDAPPFEGSVQVVLNFERGKIVHIKIHLEEDRLAQYIGKYTQC
jgi:transcriptional regulator with XRE-family HTH domain